MPSSAVTTTPAGWVRPLGANCNRYTVELLVIFDVPLARRERPVGRSRSLANDSCAGRCPCRPPHAARTRSGHSNSPHSSELFPVGSTPPGFSFGWSCGIQAFGCPGLGDGGFAGLPVWHAPGGRGTRFAQRLGRDSQRLLHSDHGVCHAARLRRARLRMIIVAVPCCDCRPAYAADRPDTLLGSARSWQ